MKAERNNKKSGQTLLEMVIALAVALMVIIALATVAIKSVRNAQFSRNQTQAQRYAQEAIERVRTARDQKGWIVFESTVFTCYQVDTASWDLITGTDCVKGDQILDQFGNPTIFTRLITITDDSNAAVATERNVNITITWSDPNGAQSTRLDTKLTRWQ